MDKRELLLKAYLGECIPGLLHNVGNPLGAMLGFVNILREEVTWLRHDLDSFSDDELRNKVGEGLTKIAELFDFAARSEQSMRKAMDKMVLKCNRDFDDHEVDIDLNELVRIETDVLMTNAFFKHKITKKFEYGRGSFHVCGLWRTYSQPIGSILFRYTIALATASTPQMTLRTSRVNDRMQIVISANTHLSQSDLASIGELMPALTLQDCSEVLGKQGTVSYAVLDGESSSITFDLALG